jgi:antitoxin component of MazEF toxin-antitoxin module
VCLDHAVIVNAAGLQRVRSAYVACSRERISRSRRMRQSHFRSCPHQLAASLPRRKWADFTTATIAPLLNRRRRRSTHRIPGASTADWRARSSSVRRLLPARLFRRPTLQRAGASASMTMPATCAMGIAAEETTSIEVQMDFPLVTPSTSSSSRVGTFAGRLSGVARRRVARQPRKIAPRSTD